VCNLDPYCCIVEWDSLCADIAQSNCALCGGVKPGIDHIVAVDPNFVGSPLVSNGQITADVNLLGLLGQPRIGLAADGATRLILRFEVGGPGAVLFSMSDPHTGTLSSPGNNQNMTSLLAPVVQLNDGRFMAFAILKAPPDFVIPPFLNDPNLATTARLAPASAQFFPQGGGAADPVNLSLLLTRPPVMLIHGIWGDGDTFKWPLSSHQFLVVYRKNYRPTNAAWFAQNIHRPRQGIQAALSLLRQQGIAATRADVFGHSMGGLLSRLYVGGALGAQYLRNDNFNEGDIHKLVTVDTPHFGSPLAYLVVDENNTTYPGIGELINDFLGCPDCGAGFDLRPNNPIYATMPAANVPCHAMVGKGGSDIVQIGIEVAVEAGVHFFAPYLAPVLRAIEMLRFAGVIPQDLFSVELQHDAVVGNLSQRGGLSDPLITTFELEIDTTPTWAIHTTVTANDVPPFQRAVELLNTHVTSAQTFAPAFPAGPPPGLAEQGPPPKFRFNIVVGLELTAPLPDFINAGDSITVAVNAINGFEPVTVLFLSNLDSAELTEPPYATALETPAAAMGPNIVQVMAVDEEMNVAILGPFTVNVLTRATLAGLTAEPESVVLFNYSGDESLVVTGQFSDGVDRTITGPAFGTTYQSAEPSIASVSADGTIEAAGVGTTTITVSNAGFQALVDVEVQSVPRIGDFNLDGAVGPFDLAQLLAAWGDCSSTQYCPQDISPPGGDGNVGPADLAQLLAHWG
jgi:pimeloyl-ACP methyl ester carboxylesterase